MGRRTVGMEASEKKAPWCVWHDRSDGRTRRRRLIAKSNSCPAASLTLRPANAREGAIAHSNARKNMPPKRSMHRHKPSFPHFRRSTDRLIFRGDSSERMLKAKVRGTRHISLVSPYFLERNNQANKKFISKATLKNRIRPQWRNLPLAFRDLSSRRKTLARRRSSPVRKRRSISRKNLFPGGRKWAGNLLESIIAGL